MTTPLTSPADADGLALSPSAWNTIRQGAFAGRITLLVAAFITLLAAWINRPLEGAFVGVIVTLMALGTGALAGLSLFGGVKRQFDAGAALLALLLAGGEALQAFGLVGTGIGAVGGKEFYVLPMFAWILLLVGGLALFATLLPGPVATATREIPNPFQAPPGGSPQPQQQGYAPQQSGTTSAFAPQQPADPAPSYAPPEERPTSSFAPPEERPTSSFQAPEPREEPRPADPDPAPPTPAPASDTTASDPAPGWYPSPDGRTAQWWDGATWTGERRPLSDFEDDEGRRDG